MAYFTLHKKDSLVLAVIDVIDACGIQGLTIREVAKRVGVTEGAVYKHYKSKNELILAALDNFSMYDNDIKEAIRLKNMDPKEAIIFFMTSYATYYENYPAITALTELYNELAIDPELAEKVKEIYLSRFEFVKALVQEAQVKGVLKADLNSQSIAYVIIGLLRAVCLKWRLEDIKFSITEQVLSSLTMILDSFGCSTS